MTTTATLVSAPAGRLLTFDLASEVFAISAESVQEILEVPQITRVPGASAFANGLVNVRGTVVPLADLRVPFGMEPRAHCEDTRVIVIEDEIAGDREMFAILADKVNDVADLDDTDLDEAPRIGSRWPPEYIVGIGRRADRFVIIPNIRRIFGDLLEPDHAAATDSRDGTL